MDCSRWQEPAKLKTLKWTHEGPAGERLDLSVAKIVPCLTRSRIQRLIKAGHITVNGQEAKAGQRLKPGDVVTMELPPPSPSRCMPEPIELDIVFEDPWLMVINKPPGLVVHPGAGHPGGTLVNALLHHRGGVLEAGGVERAGLVHRLDKDTSGLLIVAKDADVQRELSRQFKERTVQKNYLAMVVGRMGPSSGTTCLPIGRHPNDRKRISTRTRSPREAVTSWAVLQSNQYASLLQVRPHTGRTHQIRVHLAAMGHPVIGDRIYGKGALNKLARTQQVPNELLKIGRQLLHAHTLTIVHPKEGRSITFKAPLPEDFRSVLILCGFPLPEIDN